MNASMRMVFLATTIATGAAGAAAHADSPEIPKVQGSWTTDFEIRPERLSDFLVPAPLVMWDESPHPYVLVATSRNLELWHATPHAAAPTTAVALEAPLAMHGLAQCRDGNIATLTATGQLRVWSSTLTALAHIDTTATNRATGLAAVGIRRGKVVWTGDRLGIIHVASWSDPKSVRDLKVDTETIFRRLSISDDEKLLLAQSDEHALLIDLTSGRTVDRLKTTRAQGEFRAGRFAPDGKSWWVIQGQQVVARALDGKALLTVTSEIDGSPGYQQPLVFSRDGRFFFISDGARVCRYQRGDGQRAQCIGGFEAWSKPGGLDPDGTRILTVTGQRLSSYHLQWP